MKLRLSSIVLSILVLILFALVTFEFTSFEWISMKVNAISVDNDASSWNIDLFQQMKFNAIIAIVFLSVIITFLIFKIDTFKKWIDGLGYFITEQFHKCIRVFRSNNFIQNITLLFIIVIAGFVRFILYNDPITYDEAFSVNQYSTTSFLNIVSNYNYPNNHVFYNLINKFIFGFFSPQEWVIRLPSFLAGMLCLPFVYILGIQLFNNVKKAIFLVSLFAFSPILIEYSVLARGYSLIWLFSIWSFIAINAYFKTNEQKYLTLFIIFNVLALWTIPIAILPCIVLVLYTANRKGVKISLKITIATLIGAALLYLPILLIYGLNVSSQMNMEINESYTRLFDYHTHHSLMDFYYNFIMTKPVYFSFIAILFLLMIIKKSIYKRMVFLVSLSIIIIMVLQKTIPPARVWSVLLLFIYLPMSDVIVDLFKHRKHSYLIFLPLIILAMQLSFNQKKTFIMTDFRYESAEIIVSSISEPTYIICTYPMEAPLQYYWTNYLRDQNQFNVAGDNLMVVVSLKHEQDLQEICTSNNINEQSLVLTFKNEEVEVYQRNESNFINFEF
jgi:4-amino-4-deoxy-L-arabinose transferase-like glycosyltransferase